MVARRVSFEDAIFQVNRANGQVICIARPPDWVDHQKPR